MLHDEKENGGMQERPSSHFNRYCPTEYVKRSSNFEKIKWTQFSKNKICIDQYLYSINYYVEMSHTMQSVFIHYPRIVPLNYGVELYLNFK